MTEKPVSDETAEAEEAPKVPVGNPRRDMEAIASKAYAAREAETQEIDDDEPEDEPEVVDEVGESSPEAEAQAETAPRREDPKPIVQPEQRAIPVRLPDGRVLYLNEQQAAIALQQGVQSILTGGARPPAQDENPEPKPGKGITDEDLKDTLEAIRYGDEDVAQEKFKKLVTQIADQKSAVTPGLTRDEAERLATQAVENRLRQQQQMADIARNVMQEFPEVFEDTDQGKKLQELSVVYRDRLKADFANGQARTKDGEPITDIAGLYREAARRASEFASAPANGGTSLADKDRRKMEQRSTPRPGLKATRRPADPDANLTMDQRREKDRAAHIARMQSARRGVPLSQ